MAAAGPGVHVCIRFGVRWIAVSPSTRDIVRAQMEGGIGFGLGHILCRGTLDQGRPVQRNFDTYRSLRINEMPEFEVTILPSAEKLTGVGEPGVPPIGPAVANAMARLGLGRPRRLPIVKGAASMAWEGKTLG
jgi:isoquinoline 1-oxidoreductase subunit beta